MFRSIFRSSSWRYDCVTKSVSAAVYRWKLVSNWNIFIFRLRIFNAHTRPSSQTGRQTHALTARNRNGWSWANGNWFSTVLTSVALIGLPTSSSSSSSFPMYHRNGFRLRWIMIYIYGDAIISLAQSSAADDVKHRSHRHTHTNTSFTTQTRIRIASKFNEISTVFASTHESVCPMSVSVMWVCVCVYVHWSAVHIASATGIDGECVAFLQNWTKI